jgi:hypothetical protein
MRSLRLPSATTGCPSSLGALDRCNPSGSAADAGHEAAMGRPVPRQFLRHGLLDLTDNMPTTAYYRRSYAERYSG